MDEKTEGLRDVFVSVAESETVTASQERRHGTLADKDGTVWDGVEDVVAGMCERYAFETSLSDGTYASIVRAVHRGEDDGAIAADLGLDPETVFEARLDLHLFDEADLDAPVDLSAFGGSDAPRDHPDVDGETLERYRRIAAARDESRAANHRYRRAFATLLTDADLEGGLTDRAQEDGLAEAAADIETDVSF